MKNRKAHSTKSIDRKPIDRRNFLEIGVAAAVGSAAAACSRNRVGASTTAAQPGSTTAPAPSTTAPKPSAANVPKPLATRMFGKTGRELPILGFGGAALPRIFGNPLSTEDRVKLVRHAYERGIRYFDTAGNYMESQSILGEGLQGVRDDIFLVTKVETTDPTKVRGAVEKSLKELQTDHLDAILIHGTPGIEQMTVEQAMKIHAELVNMRSERIVEFIGLSAHSYFDKALALISTGTFDLCMLSYGYLPRGFDQVLSSRMVALRNACIAKAHDLGMGIVAMKVVGGGVLGAWSEYVVKEFDNIRRKQLPAAAIRWALDDERVHILDIGMRLKAEVDANIKTLSEDVTYTVEDRGLLAEFSAKVVDSEIVKNMKID